MGDMRWRLVGDAEVLRQRSCWRLHCVSSSSTGHQYSQSASALEDLVLVYVTKLGKFFALDGTCSHIGESNSSSSPLGRHNEILVTCHCFVRYHKFTLSLVADVCPCSLSRLRRQGQSKSHRIQECMKPYKRTTRPTLRMLIFPNLGEEVPL